MDQRPHRKADGSRRDAMNGWRFIREKYTDHLTITCQTAVGEMP